ncbi:SAM-dependent methyltransferase [Streptomyces sp. A7024]|uniref:SAM-dependent methyltransferase n=1 Tax=Streptomyces coryli TaxID=1128680 RepID=A0A6G4UDJ3_9ACTN|nr:class I SAM-dependent methyltransferase [Streptomyces coryli]NGN70082.1 SAM-dependent methyltransferase [Streptomyces coryli]
MDDTPLRTPPALARVQAAAEGLDFTMSCEPRTGALLAALAAATGPGGRILELGTGVGEGAAWLLSGAAPDATLVSVELDAAVQAVARAELAADARARFVTEDGGGWLEAYEGPGFDLVFADTWPGKFTHRDAALALLRPGGTYLIDDLTPQPDWPADHRAAVDRLIADLESRPGLRTARLAWSSGLLMAVRT